MHVLKVAFRKISLKSFIPFKICLAAFTSRGLLDELLNKFSCTGLGRPMDFIPRDASCCSFHVRGSFLSPCYPALKMTAPLNEI